MSSDDKQRSTDGFVGCNCFHKQLDDGIWDVRLGSTMMPNGYAFVEVVDGVYHEYFYFHDNLNSTLPTASSLSITPTSHTAFNNVTTLAGFMNVIASHNDFAAFRQQQVHYKVEYGYSF